MAMAKGPRGGRRPADVNARAVVIAKIATGEIEDVEAQGARHHARNRGRADAYRTEHG
jgi:hypothetical protein